MSNTGVNSIPLPNTDKNDVENLTIVNPIEFISDEENQNLLNTVTQRLIDSNNPDKWIKWEKFEQKAKEKFNL